MPYIRGTIHGIASMIMLIVGTILAETIREEYEIFATLSSTIQYLLLDIARIPVSEEIAGVILPLGILMATWVSVYELRQIIIQNENE